MIEKVDLDKFTVHGTVVPKHIRPSLLRYIKKGGQTGSFLQAVIENDLRVAIGSADKDALHGLPAIISYFTFHAPSECWGSPEAYRNWEGTEK